MSNRLPDEIAACKLIAQHRREERNYTRRNLKVKSITTFVDMVEGRKMSASLSVRINTKTGKILIQSCALMYYGQRIHPSTHDKRTCGSEKALNVLNAARRYSREGSRRRRQKS
jgi:hypothetical protein